MTPLPVVDELDTVTIPNPCSVTWEEMKGDNRTRLCDKCQQKIHDISDLTRAEALKLVNGENVPCLRILRRPDGRVMTADCLTRRERAMKWLSRRSLFAAAVVAAVASVVGCGASPTVGKK